MQMRKLTKKVLLGLSAAVALHFGIPGEALVPCLAPSVCSAFSTEGKTPVFTDEKGYAYYLDSLDVNDDGYGRTVRATSTWSNACMQYYVSVKIQAPDTAKLESKTYAFLSDWDTGGGYYWNEETQHWDKTQKGTAEDKIYDETCKKAAAIEPDEAKNRRAEAFVNAGEYYFNQRDNDNAVRSCSEALKIAAKDFSFWPRANCYWIRGRAYYRKQEWTKAADDFASVMGMSSNNPASTSFSYYKDALFERGCAYLEMEKYRKAVEDFTEFISIQPGPDAYINRGTAYQSLKLYDEALADYEKALSWEPSYSDKLREAIAAIRKAKSQNG